MKKSLLLLLIPLLLPTYALADSDERSICAQERATQCVAKCEQADGSDCTKRCQEDAWNECRQAGE